VELNGKTPPELMRNPLAAAALASLPLVSSLLMNDGQVLIAR
jgi:hypothetical protein